MASACPALKINSDIEKREFTFPAIVRYVSRAVRGGVNSWEYSVSLGSEVLSKLGIAASHKRVRGIKIKRNGFKRDEMPCEGDTVLVQCRAKVSELEANDFSDIFQRGQIVDLIEYA